MWNQKSSYVLLCFRYGLYFFCLFFFLGCPPCWVASSLQILLLVYCFTGSFFFSFLSTRVIILWYFANFFNAYWLLIRTIFRNLGRWDIFTNLFGEELKVVFATDFSENKVKCKKQNIAIADILHINIMNHIIDQSVIWNKGQTLLYFGQCFAFVWYDWLINYGSWYSCDDGQLMRSNKV